MFTWLRTGAEELEGVQKWRKERKESEVTSKAVAQTSLGESR